jgi:hypothetical protein
MVNFVKLSTTRKIIIVWAIQKLKTQNYTLILTPALMNTVSYNTPDKLQKLHFATNLH